MFDTYYTDKIEYMTFFEAMIEEQREMEDYVNECITLSGSNNKVFNEFQVFNEGKFGDKVKALFNRLRSFFSKIWQKFLEKLRAWVGDNKEYLETYKDIIIGKKVKIDNVKMPDHLETGWPRIEAAINKVTEFSKPISDAEFQKIHDNSDKNSGKGSDAEGRNNELINYKKSQYTALFAANALNINTTDVPLEDDDLPSVSANLTKYFKGGDPDTVHSSDDLTDNMSKMYKVIYSYNEVVNGLNKIQETFTSAMNKSEQAYNNTFEKIKSAIGKVQTAKKAVDTENNETNRKAKTAADSTLNTLIDKSKKQQKPESNDEEETVIGLASYKWSLKNNEMYIGEGEVTVGSSGSNSSSDDKSGLVKVGGKSVDNSGASAEAKSKAETLKTADTAVKKSNSDVKIDGTDAAVKGIQKASGGDKLANYEKVDMTKLNEFQTHATNLINAYATCRTTIFGALLNAIQATRVNYMTVIRAHVSSYVGTVNDTGDDTNKSSV